MPRVALTEITAETVRDVLALAVAPAQRDMVASNAESIAQAHFDPRAWFRAITADGQPVGFVSLLDVPDERLCYVWRLMIDARHQRRGYGRTAMQLVIERAQARADVDAVTLSRVDLPGNAGPFYRSLGFEDAGPVGGEIGMRLRLRD